MARSHPLPETQNPLRIDTITIRKVKQPFQIVKFLFLPQLFHIGKHRPEIRRTKSRQFAMHKEVIELFALCDLHILSDFTVTLQDMHIDLTEKILPGCRIL